MDPLWNKKFFLLPMMSELCLSKILPTDLQDEDNYAIIVAMLLEDCTAASTPLLLGIVSECFDDGDWIGQVA